MKKQPSVVIGSSSEGLAIAEALQEGLSSEAEVQLWTQGVFELSQGTLESLSKVLHSADFAVLVLTPDDLTFSRGKEEPSPRDNVLFELGLFMGHLGRRRCFFVIDRTRSIKLPSDLLGVAAVTYQPHEDGNFQAAIGPACTAIKRALRTLGTRPRLIFNALNDAEADTNLPNLSGTG